MDILSTVRQKCFFGILLVGGLAGLCESHWEHQGVLFNFFCGLIVVTLGGFIGSFFGFFFKNLLRYLRRYYIYAGELSDGTLMGSLFGAVVGIIIQMIFGTEPHTALGAAMGATVGGFLGALPDETILSYVLEAMYTHEENIVDIVDLSETCPPDSSHSRS